MFDDKVIPLWLMVYDQNPKRSYLFSSREKVITSIEGQIRSVVPDDQVEEVSSQVCKCLRDTADESFISMMIPPDTVIFVHRIELDKHNKVHQVLNKCWGAMMDGKLPGDEVLSDIDTLFCDPI